jgi:hypothetical protein
MKRRSTIIAVIVMQSLLILLSLVYAFFQRSIADEQTRLAQSNQQIAFENDKKCQERLSELEERLVELEK